MRRVIQQALLLLFGSSAIGVLVNTVSPRGIPYIRPPRSPVPAEEEISVKDAERLWGLGEAVFLDARTPDLYEAGHIPGAHNLPTQEFETYFVKLQGIIGRDDTMVAYCDGVLCELSHELAEKLRELGYPNVKVLVNGWTVWQEAGLPATTGAAP